MTIGIEIRNGIHGHEIISLHGHRRFVLREGEPAVRARISDRRTGGDLHKAVVRQTGRIPERRDAIDVEMARKNEMYSMRHEAITQCVSFLKAASTLQCTLLVKMLQDLPVRHRDDRSSLSHCFIGSGQNPCKG